MINPCISDNRGYSIYLVLLVLTITGILLSVSLYQIRISETQSIIEQHKFQAKMLAESGIERAQYFLNGGDGHSFDWETDNFEENIENWGSIKIQNKKEGLFSKIITHGIRIKSECIISGLFGRDLPKQLQPSLTLTGHVGGLVLPDQSNIDGYIVLHHEEIYRNRRGRPLEEYQRRLIIRESPSLPFDSLKIPALMKILADDYHSCLSEKKSYTGNLDITKPNDSLSAKEKVIVHGNCSIHSGPIRGKKLIISGSLYLYRNAVVRESEVYADKIFIEDGTTEKSLFYSSKQIELNGGGHNSQFFACDSLKVSNKVTFGKMNVLVGYRDSVKDTLRGGVFIEKGTKITGTIISVLNPGRKNSLIAGPSICLGKECVLNGTLVTDYDVDLNEVTIKGNLWARSIVTTDGKQSYTNYLLKSTIKKPEIEIPFPLLGSTPAQILFEKSEIGVSL